jgi:hypothetical protein
LAASRETLPLLGELFFIGSTTSPGGRLGSKKAADTSLDGYIEKVT